MTSKKVSKTSSIVERLARLSTHASDKILTQVLLLPIDEVVSKEQVRTIFNEIEELAKTIKSDQQQSPILVAPKNDEGKYVILKGERRWRACKHLGLEHIKAIIDPKAYTSNEIIIGELVENIQREDLAPFEIANAIQRLLDGGLTRTEIQEKLGKSQSYVSMHISMVSEIPDILKDLLKAQPFLAAQTVVHLKKAFELDEQATKKACLEYKANGVSRAEAKLFLDSVVSKNTPVESNDAGAAGSPVLNTNKDEVVTDLKPVHELDTPGISVDSELNIQPRASTEKPLEEDSPESNGNHAQAVKEAPARASGDVNAVKRPVTLAQVVVSRKIDGKKQLGLLSLELVSDSPDVVWVDCNGEEVLWETCQIMIEGVHEDS